MLSKVIFCLPLTSFLHVVINAKEFQFLNKLPEEIWVGCQGNKNFANLNNGGWKLTPGHKMSVTPPDNWEGRFWGRTLCNPNTQHCQTGDCGNKLQCNGAGGEKPFTIAEIALKAEELDYYDVSLVDGFNIQMSMEPLGGQSNGNNYSCKKTQCTHNFLSDCPNELRVKGDNGQVIACHSACSLHKTDEYCCKGAYNTSETCKPSDWDKKFKNQCPDAYSYGYDDHKSTYTCNAPAYLITFGA